MGEKLKRVKRFHYAVIRYASKTSESLKQISRPTALGFIAMKRKEGFDLILKIRL